MKKTKILSGLLAALIISSTLASCGNGTNDSSSNDSSIDSNLTVDNLDSNHSCSSSISISGVGSILLAGAAICFCKKKKLN